MGTVGLLHPGEMGASIGAALRRAGVPVLWVSAGRGPATRRRAQAADLTDAGTLPELLAASQVVVSVCPPHAAAEVAGAAGELYRRLASFKDVQGDPPLGEVLGRVRMPPSAAGRR